jgi:hypothetical protein
MQKSTALVCVLASTAGLALIWISDYMAKRRRAQAVGTSREVRMRFSSWTLRLPDRCNMEEAMTTYEQRYSPTFERRAGESARKFKMRTRIEYIGECIHEFDPEVQHGLRRLLAHYASTMLMPEGDELRKDA